MAEIGFSQVPSTCTDIIVLADVHRDEILLSFCVITEVNISLSLTFKQFQLQCLPVVSN